MSLCILSIQLLPLFILPSLIVIVYLEELYSALDAIDTFPIKVVPGIHIF